MVRASRAAAVLLLAALAGCSKPVPPADPPVPQPAAVGPAVTADEAKAFAAKLEAAMTAGDETAFAELFPIADMMKQSVADLNLPALPAARQAQLTRQFAGQMLGQVRTGGSYHFLHVHDVNGKPRALFRYLQPDGGLNYHDVVLARTADGRVTAEDAHVLVTGEPLRQTFRRLMIQLMSEPQRQGLVGQDQVYARHLNEISGFMRNVREGDAKQALAAFRGWPAELQKEKALALMAVLAAGKTGDDADYLKQLAAYRAAFPDDASGDLVSLDYLLLMKRYDDTRQAVDRLDKAVDGDPYLDVLRANVFAETGKFPEAKALADKAVAAEPTLTAAHWARVSVSLTEKNHADTLTHLKRLVEKRGVQLDVAGMAEDKDYAHFVKSPQYAELKTWYAARPKK